MCVLVGNLLIMHFLPKEKFLFFIWCFKKNRPKFQVTKKKKKKKNKKKNDGGIIHQYGF